MDAETKFLLDSGDPDEYKEIIALAKSKGEEIWGSTTNPSLIAKKLQGKKITQQQALDLQKEIVLEILSLVPGAVSAEVYADEHTTAEEMIVQGKEIATWHPRIIVKLPTTIEGFKARTTLRKNNIPVNNTLVFSQEQIFAICLHEKIIQHQFGPTNELWLPFISPFIGRLDDIGLSGMDLVDHGMKIKKEVGAELWMLAASVRTLDHMKASLALNAELITAPGKLYKEWFALSKSEKEKTPEATKLQPIPYWTPTADMAQIETVDAFIDAITSKKLSIQHDLTDKGIARFAQDWKAIIV